VKPKKIEDSP
jgi:hypothetical protein